LHLSAHLSVCVLTHLFKTLRVCRPNEVRLHVINAALWVHQILVVLPLNLNHAHDDAIDHVNGLALVIFPIAALLVVFNSLAILHLVLDALGALVVLENAILYARAALIERSTIEVAALPTHLLSVFGA